MNARAQDALREELMAQELRYWDAIKASDAATCAALSSDPCLVVGAQGAREVSPKAFEAMMKQDQSCKLQRYAIEDVHLLSITPEVAALAYTVKAEFRFPDGSSRELKSFDTSVWKQDGRGGWACHVHTETPEGDPLGDAAKA